MVEDSNGNGSFCNRWNTRHEFQLHRSNQQELEFLLIVTGDMQEAFDLFLEVLMIDGTYRVNKLRMPLCIFMVEDSNGNGSFRDRRNT